MIYLDSSAAVKLLHREDHSTELQAFLEDRPRDALVSSVLLEVELARALRRWTSRARPRIEQFLQQVYRSDIDRSVRNLAAAFENPYLQSLDAIHLATALTYHQETNGGLDHFVAYDTRLLAAAAAHDLPIASPGMRS